MIRHAGIEQIAWNQDRWKLGSNLINGNDTELCAESKEEAERLIGKVNNIVKGRLLKLNVK